LHPQVGARNGIEADIEAFERQAKPSRVVDFFDVAEHHERIEHAEGGALVETGTTRDVGQNQLRLIAGERLKDLEAFGERLHHVLFGCCVFAHDCLVFPPKNCPLTRLLRSSEYEL
jgi:hypothetical protein